jgi:anti-sigma regulatory factor (Ser/Thr protein kinase)
MHESHACATRQQHVRRPGAACPLRYAHSFPGQADQIRHVRACLREILAAWPRAGDAVAVASELAANSVLHSRSGLPGGVFTVRAEVHRGTGTCIAVQDEGGAWDFRPGKVRPEHGLDVVQALAGPGNWGVGGDAAGRIVWARLLWPRTAPPPVAADDGTGDDGVLADLDTLATELAAHGVEARLVIPGGNHSPHLVVHSAGLTDRVYAQADWFFWPTSERIAARDDVQTAFVTIIRFFNGQSGASYA